MTQSAELLPCPFCGCEASERCEESAGPYWIECDMCGVRGVDFRWSDNGVAAWNTRALTTTPEPTDPAGVSGVAEARDILSGLSSYLGAGLGDDGTTLAQYDDRIRWGIDHIGSVYRNRAAQVVEECSKRPRTTWGDVKRAILDDTCLPTASGKAAALRPSPVLEVAKEALQGLPDDETTSRRILELAFADAGLKLPFFGEAYEPGVVIRSVVEQAAALQAIKEGEVR